MRVVFGSDAAGIPPGRDATESIARRLQTADASDYWLLVYDFYGMKLFDAVVQAKVLPLDREGNVLAEGEGSGSPDQQVFVITQNLPEDAVKFMEAFTAERPAQVAWKRLPPGSFYLPLEWPSHTNGLPNVGPYLVQRWERGEWRDLGRRQRIAAAVLDWWMWWFIGGSLAGLVWWLRDL